MMLWIVFAMMTGLAILAIIVPLARGRAGAATGAEGDMAVYRDQLAAVDEEVARGTLDASEAEAARTEISRRLLAAGARDENEARRAPASGHRYSAVAVALGIGVIAVSLGGYLALGSPDLPGDALVARQARPPNAQDPQMLLAKVEAHLQENPDDGKGWDLVAPVYMEFNRFKDAARAYSNALRLLGEDPERLAGLGQALTYGEDGMVTADARKAFERALALDPELLPARFYLALGLEQDGALEKAAAAWRALLAGAPAQAPWRGIVEQHLAAVSARLADGPPGAEAVPDAAAQLPAERTKMIEQMVVSLAERLNAEGGEAEEWVMLMRSYSVLGRDVEARETLGRARERFAGDRAALQTIEAAAGTLKLNDVAPPGGGPT
jgi:cytochrome c-type biogenesis protein CcmH